MASPVFSGGGSAHCKTGLASAFAAQFAGEFTEVLADSARLRRLRPNKCKPGFPLDSLASKTTEAARLLTWAATETRSGERSGATALIGRRSPAPVRPLR